MQHTYYKIINEEPVTFVNELSVVAPCSKIVALACFYHINDL